MRKASDEVAIQPCAEIGQQGVLDIAGFARVVADLRGDPRVTQDAVDCRWVVEGGDAMFVGAQHCLGRVLIAPHFKAGDALERQCAGWAVPSEAEADSGRGGYLEPLIAEGELRAVISAGHCGRAGT